MKAKKAAEEALQLLSQLDIDNLGLRVWLEKKTKFGRKMDESDPFAFTKQYLAKYSENAETETVINILKSQGITNDIECGRWLLVHDSLIP